MGRKPRAGWGVLVLLPVVMHAACATRRMTVGGDPIRTVPFARLIPAVNEPEFATVEEAAGFMRDEEPVLGLPGAPPKAYSLWMLDRHEVVNDAGGSDALAVMWCPLAACARAYGRTVDGRQLTFRVSGKLWRGALVVEDRETGSMWSQIDGTAIAGPLCGRKLPAVRALPTTWREWRRLHPDTLVLRKEWYDRRGHSDYDAYNADPTRLGLFQAASPDDRLPGKTLVVGLDADGTPAALPLASVRETPLFQAALRGGFPLAIRADPGGRSAQAYSRCVDGAVVDLEVLGGADERAPLLVDRQTGSTWDAATLVATHGPLSGQALRPLPAQVLYWFVWARFHPATEVLGSAAPEHADLARR